MSIDSKKRRSLPLKVCLSRTRSYDSYYRYLSSWPQWPHHNFTRKHDVEKILFLTTFCRRLSSLVNQAGTLPLALCREKGSMKTKNGFDAFTHLSPAPDVQIEKERFSEVRRVLALRVPKVSTLSCYAASFFFVSRRSHRVFPPLASSLFLRQVPEYVSRFVGPLFHRITGKVSVLDERPESDGPEHSKAPLRAERPRGARRVI